jgi:acetyl/propionyl-CoA carboxylase alpha subunit
VVRVDTGIYEGGEVSMYYDPMIAKLITYGSTRDRAIAHMRDALNEFFIRGVAHNISFLAALMVHTRFMTGRISTNMIAEEYPNGFHAADVPHDDPALLISVAAFLHRRYMDRAARDQRPVAGARAQGRQKRLGGADGRPATPGAHRSRRGRLRRGVHGRKLSGAQRMAVRLSAVQRHPERHRHLHPGRAPRHDLSAVPLGFAGGCDGAVAHGGRTCRR